MDKASPVRAQVILPNKVCASVCMLPHPQPCNVVSWILFERSYDPRSAMLVSEVPRLGLFLDNWSWCK